MGVAKTLRERQLEDHERGDDRLEEAGPTPASTPEEQRRDRLATGAKAVLLVELVLALAGGALHHLQIQGDIEFRSLTATTLLVAGSGAIVFGLLCLGLVRRFASTEKRADGLAIAASVALFPVLLWFSYFIGRSGGYCIKEFPDGSERDFTCVLQESGAHLLVDDISSYLGWPALGAGAITAMFIAAAFACSRPDRGDSTFLRRNLTCAILVSAVPAVVFALDLGDAAKTEMAWTALAVLVVIAPPAIHAIRRRTQLERVRKAGLRPRF
ncbi:hypothetical protein [Saccharopolyspora shandongensis]|uniref:hypothetical protein n=1 Tax=Saccharopolyspora shandongensis TaxID=418495 RepID=UPI0033C47517